MSLNLRQRFPSFNQLVTSLNIDIQDSSSDRLIEQPRLPNHSLKDVLWPLTPDYFRKLFKLNILTKLVYAPRFTEAEFNNNTRGTKALVVCNVEICRV